MMGGRFGRGLLYLIYCHLLLSSQAFVVNTPSRLWGRSASPPGALPTKAHEAQQGDGKHRATFLSQALLTTLGVLAVGSPSPTQAAAAAPEVTDRVFMEVRIVGFNQGSEEATTVERKGRLVLGLYGKAAPTIVKQFLGYASTPYGSDVKPSYSFSYFIKRIPNVLIEGGGIRGLKKIEIAGSTQFEWGRQILPAVFEEEGEGSTTALSHDRRGLLTKSKLDDVRDPVFGITLGPARQLDSERTVFGTILEGQDFLYKIEDVPIYESRPAGESNIVQDFFQKEQKLFLELGKELKDTRAVDRTGVFLKRVEVENVGILEA